MSGQGWEKDGLAFIMNRTCNDIGMIRIIGNDVQERIRLAIEN